MMRIGLSDRLCPGAEHGATTKPTKHRIASIRATENGRSVIRILPDELGCTLRPGAASARALRLARSCRIPLWPRQPVKAELRGRERVRSRAFAAQASGRGRSARFARLPSPAFLAVADAPRIAATAPELLRAAHSAARERPSVDGVHRHDHGGVG